MPFTFRNHDLDGLLVEPLNAADSLYAHFARVHRGIHQELVDHWTKFRGAKPGAQYGSVKGAFAAIEGWWSKAYDDDKVIGRMYEDRDAAALLRALSGHADLESFMTAFEQARLDSFVAFVQPLSLLTLSKRSFALTYFHKDIAELFLKQPHATQLPAMKSRVVETAEIMLRILYGNMNGAWRMAYGTRTFVTAILLGVMHNKLLRGDNTYRSNTRGAMRHFYNQSSVAYTLLTFAGVVHSAHLAAADGTLSLVLPELKGQRPQRFDFPAASWYLMWKLIGSFMGVSARLIPNDYAESEALLKAFTDEGETYRMPNEIQGLLDVLAKVDIGPKDLLAWIPAIQLQGLLKDISEPFDVFDD
jgi:hypothetical protein